MSRGDRSFQVRSGSDRLVQLSPDVIPPITGFGKLIAPGTLLVPKELVDAAGQDLIGDVFDNVTIEFALDPGAMGASAVDNDDNWGIGPDGLDAGRFWDKGFRGQGVRIGIADSGLDSTHPAFVDLVAEQRLSAFAQFDKSAVKQVQKNPDGSALPDSQAVPTFSHWHGTHCAGILVGQPTDGKARGMAPAAELAVTRVLEQSNEGSVAGIGAGLWWLTEQHCQVVSISLGWPGLHEEWAAPVEALLKDGVVVVAAVGNEFDVAGVAKSRSPANYLTVPADDAAGILVCVGAHDRAGAVWDSSGGEVVNWSAVTVAQTDGSTRASRFASVPARTVPVMVAPGVDIISSIPGDKYLSSPGSSMATPHVAGLIALVLSGLRAHDPATRPRAAAELVLASLVDEGDPGVDIRFGGGRVDLDRLLASIG
ncbi:S8 family peptidase [Mycolicibacterium cosmeticum]|uniref:Intracellular serine protease n=1 Tax=Mycolicibacterium cosmeticum TaxID=258533 RepID=W9AX00_MYCCO|nr:S8 family serine peptidase [Mycolicibacterium cosmeticum]CDO10359.1 Intracellular serine protease [Mycolicibacterium cosmeticum]